MYLSIFSDELGIDLTEGLPMLKSWGFNRIDLRGRILGRHFEGLSPAQLTEVRDMLDAQGFRLGCLQSSLAKCHLPDAAGCQAEADKLEAILRAADALDCRLVRSFFFWQPPKDLSGELVVRPDLFQAVLDRFGPLAERAKAEGLILGFENCGVTTDEVLAVLDALRRPDWGLAWDVSNEWDAEARKRDPAAYFTRLAKRSVMVHVKARGAVDGLGERIPYDQVLQICLDTGLEGPVSIETHNPDRTVSNLDQSRKLHANLIAAWPSAAPGLAEAPAAGLRFTRDYDPVGFVVVGLGMGHNRAKALQQTPGVKLLGVCDIDPERARRTREALDVPATTDIAPWLDDPTVEAVFVVTPTGRHAEVALQALRAGKAVLSTKPMEASLESCDLMIREAEARQLLLGVDFEMRLNENLTALREALAAKRFGRILGGECTLKIQRTMDYFQAQGGWRGTRRWDGGGVFSNQSIHHIDQMVYALGVPQRVKCEIRTLTHDIEAEDLGCAWWEYDSGAIVTLHATTNYPQDTWHYRMELYGTDGACLISAGGALEKPLARWYDQGAWSDSPPCPVAPQWMNSADNFASALRTGTPLLCPGRDGRRTQAVLDAMYRSAYGKRDWTDVQAEYGTD